VTGKSNTNQIEQRFKLTTKRRSQACHAKENWTCPTRKPSHQNQRMPLKLLEDRLHGHQRKGCHCGWWRLSCQVTGRFVPIVWLIGQIAELLFYSILIRTCYLQELQYKNNLLWSPYVIGQTIIFLPVVSFFFFYLSFFPRLLSAAADWMSTILLHMAWPCANLECRSEMCSSLQIQDAKKSPSGHHRTTSTGYIFATKARIDNRKKTC